MENVQHMCQCDNFGLKLSDKLLDPSIVLWTGRAEWHHGTFLNAVLKLVLQTLT